EARIAMQAARVELARKARLPDIDVSVQYGQRRGFADMLTEVVSVPLPLHHARKQDQELTGATAELSVLAAEHHEQVNAIRAGVARLYAELERDRTQLALYKKAVLPQADATLQSAL